MNRSGVAPQERKGRLIAAGILVLSILAGVYQGRGPTPATSERDANPQRANASRMRTLLNELLGDPPQTHSLGTQEGIAFLERIESFLDARGANHRRIEIPFDPASPIENPSPRLKFLSGETTLRNLLVTVEGTRPDLPPLLICTHHDSCVWGPGAGDAGSAVVALLDHIDHCVKHPPRRTLLYLFTDGEEFGLLGARAIAEKDTLPFREPAFVLNFDARGNRGAVPMFETHRGNANAVRHLIGHLAAPRQTTSLAVTVYRMLPNATDFNVWNQTLGWPGFNFATIGGAHHYHQPSDVPANLSDRTLQHMGDHLFSVHHALDTMDEDRFNEMVTPTDQDAVFFDVLGLWVIRSTELIQRWIAIACVCVLSVLGLREFSRRATRPSFLEMLKLLVVFPIVGAVAGLIGRGMQALLRVTDYGALSYTPVDLAFGLLTTFLVFGAALFVQSAFDRRWPIDRHRAFVGSGTWGTSVCALLISLLLPGGAYLLVVPVTTYVLVRISLSPVTDRSVAIARWAAWVSACVIVGPLIPLLVQALGPWKQTLYATLALMLAIAAWHVAKPVIVKVNQDSP
ncbi:MAG: M28 family peptidase [Planctomycetota bacterium]